MSTEISLSLKKLIQGEEKLSDSEIVSIMDSTWYLRMIVPLSEKEITDISQEKMEFYDDKNVILVMKTPMEEQDIRVQLGRIIELVTEAYDVYGIVLNLGNENIKMDRWSINNLFILNQFIYDHEAAEEKALQRMKLSMNENNLSETWIICNILCDNITEKRAEYMYYLARILESTREYRAAEEMYRKAIIEKSDNYWLYYRLAVFLEKCGREKESVNILMAAYNTFSAKLTERAPIEESFSYILKGLINNSHIGTLKKKSIISFWQKEKKKFSICQEKYVYDEL